VWLALTGGKITIGPASQSPDARRIIEVRVEIPDGAGDSDGIVRIVGYDEILDGCGRLGESSGPPSVRWLLIDFWNHSLRVSGRVLEHVAQSIES